MTIVPSLKALLLDKDGTLLDPARGTGGDASLLGSLRHSIAQCRALGFRLGILTGDNTELARADLRRLAFDDLFEVVVAADSGAGPKPGAGPCVAAAQALSLRPEDCAMVSQSEPDLAAARAVGMLAVGVAGVALPPARLVGIADLILPDLPLLATWLSAGSLLRAGSSA